MSDKTPRDDGLDPFEYDFDFPGDGEEELTQEERDFVFEEDYLEDVSPAKHKVPSVSELRENLTGQARKLTTAIVKKSRKQPEAMPEEELPPGVKISRRHKKYIPASRERDGVTIGMDLRPDEMLVYDSELDEIDYTDEGDLPEMRDYMPVRFSRHGRSGIGGGILYGLFVISISIILACMAWMFAADALALSKEVRHAVVYIEEYVPTGDMPVTNDEGETINVDVEQAASALKSAGIIEYKWLFRIFCALCDGGVEMDPGTYDVSTEQDYYSLVKSMHFGSNTQEITRVTFPEGYSMEQIFTLLEENNICKKADLYVAAADYEFDYDFLDPEMLGDASRLEGYLFPDTYDFYQGEDAVVAISRFLNNTENKLSDDIRSGARKLGISLREAIIIASLIEKEAGANDDRETMASVIYNRLDADWKLQLDSTVNYVLGTNTFDLTFDDLEVESPYNTYLHEGLPPGPICNPGLASIQAAVDPASTDYWFWYSFEGVTSFFETAEEAEAYAKAHPY